LLDTPLGASFADFMAGPTWLGGLSLGMPPISMVLFAMIVAVVAYFATERRRQPTGGLPDTPEPRGDPVGPSTAETAPIPRCTLPHRRRPRNNPPGPRKPFPNRPAAARLGVFINRLGFTTLRLPGSDTSQAGRRSAPAGSLDPVSTLNNPAALLQRGRRLEYATLGWNVVGVLVLAVGALSARSVALAGFGLDSLIEIGASTVVLWQLADTTHPGREHRAMRLIGVGFVLLVIYLIGQISYTLAVGARPAPSLLGITWTALTFLVMLALAAGKARTGTALNNPVLTAEGRVTLIDAYLAGAVLLGLVLNATLGWWWADPLAGLMIVYYGIREAREALHHQPPDPTR
jgi:Repeat of Unknown Function (DUF347)